MEALVLLLLPFALDAIKGESAAVIFSSITAQQWVSFGFDLVNLDPAVSSAIQAKLKAFDLPALETFLDDVLSGKDIEASAAVLRAFFAGLDRPAPTIPGYAGDGETIPISNPDDKQGA